MFDGAPPELTWLAAMIDGEGHIGIAQLKRKDRANPGFQVVLSVANTNMNLLDAILEITGVGNIYLNQAKTDLRRDCYKWQTTSRRAAEVLLRVQPYLIAKSEQARVALQCQALMRHGGCHFDPEEYRKKEALWQQSKRLNRPMAA